jgi:formate-dependent nitrite reductase cytochrome c552 subunit
MPNNKIKTKQTELAELIKKHEKQLQDCKNEAQYKIVASKQKEELAQVLLKYRGRAN